MAPPLLQAQDLEVQALGVPRGEPLGVRGDEHDVVGSDEPHPPMVAPLERPRADSALMAGYERYDEPPRRVAVGALAPRRRRAEVYRRRRVTLAGVVAALASVAVVPWCVSRSQDEGPAAETATTRVGTRGVGAGAGDADGCAEAVDALPLRGRLALTVMVGVDGDAPREAMTLLEGDLRPGGLFVRGGQAIWEDGTLTDRAGDGLPLLVAVDDEGGRVQPMEGVLDELPSAARLAEESPQELQRRGTERGADLRGLGINVVFGPVVDVGSAGGIGDRSFGDTSDVVTSKAGAYADGLRQAGILPVLKHFPGQGQADADTHDGPGRVARLDVLRARDLVPYDALLSEPATGVMVGHLDVPGLTEEGVPASLSPAAIGLLRSAYEFEGLVVTDDLVAMEAVRSRFEAAEAAERALAAGADLLLLSQPADVGLVLARLEEAVNLGRIPDRRLDAALDRIVAVGCPP